ncbi:GNAT family N-acetyltransferase [Yimella sp. RIT 621]|uniref:GNAT family N-acetyltransferase n=1 Tax=Yimella sp. RIT 621 TaxID=2510323 RepID=UPI00101D718C|nr:GNAT family N-acetyltransferase [Yimella sp. RIT 621]RYG77720.1 GNAT family N-acetyltransferase [Yimella sp. RIT 621]
MNELSVDGNRYSVRRATAHDVRPIVQLLADDPLGATRERSDESVYERAFAAIDADPNQFLAVVADDEAAVVGTFQLTLIPGLARAGATRLLIEAVRVSASARGTGLGAAMFGWAHEYGRSRGAVLAQLTTDKSRSDAHRFYERLGYEGSHEGSKLVL